MNGVPDTRDGHSLVEAKSFDESRRPDARHIKKRSRRRHLYIELDSFQSRRENRELGLSMAGNFSS